VVVHISYLFVQKATEL